MAVLTDIDAAKFRRNLHAEYLDLLQAESPPLTKVQLKAAAQAIEDFWETNRATIKSNMDTAVGRAISNSLAKKIGRFWLQYKWGLE